MIEYTKREINVEIGKNHEYVPRVVEIDPTADVIADGGPIVGKRLTMKLRSKYTRVMRAPVIMSVLRHVRVLAHVGIRSNRSLDREREPSH